MSIEQFEGLLNAQGLRYQRNLTPVNPSLLNFPVLFTFRLKFEKLCICFNDLIFLSLERKRNQNRYSLAINLIKSLKINHNRLSLHLITNVFFLIFFFALDVVWSFSVKFFMRLSINLREWSSKEIEDQPSNTCWTCRQSYFRLKITQKVVNWTEYQRKKRILCRLLFLASQQFLNDWTAAPNKTVFFLSRNKKLKWGGSATNIQYCLSSSLIVFAAFKLWRHKWSVVLKCAIINLDLSWVSGSDNMRQPWKHPTSTFSSFLKS